MLARKSSKPLRSPGPRDTETYSWTSHAGAKMRQYGLSESRIKRIIRFPARSEEGILSGAVAVMQPATVTTKNGKPTWSQEIWVMYILQDAGGGRGEVGNKKDKLENDPFGVLKRGGKRIRIITAWRYPGVSSLRNPVPREVLDEVRSLF